VTHSSETMLRPAEAAELLGVSLAHLRRLASTGRLVTVRTLGGHRRYREAEVRMLLANDQNPANTQSR
jgi:excisionase family DNA binding protein